MPLLDAHPKEVKAETQTHVYSQALGSITHKSQEMEATQVSIDRWIG